MLVFVSKGDNMCFSASASFAASIILIPTGIYCLREAKDNDTAYVPLAAWPLFFGIQQGFEGFVWLGITADETSIINSASLCFLFFSHFLWLFWVPFSAISLEENKLLKSILRLLAIAGFLFGSLLYFPLLINRNWIEIEVIKGSIYYVTKFFFDNITPNNFSFFLYAIIILIPLLISSYRSVNVLGGLIALAAVITYLMYHYAFISVWCFLAAVISIYLVYLINNLRIPAINRQEL
jgi:O-antigen ligase